MALISFIKNAGAKIFKSEEKREEDKAKLIMEHIQRSQRKSMVMQRNTL
jgi:hypothetical protein